METTSGIDLEDEVVHGMTASYTEISFNTQSSEPDDSALEVLNDSIQEVDGANGQSKAAVERPNKLPLNREDSQKTINSSSCTNRAVEFLNQLNGTITQDGEMVSFVAEDLETKIKLSSPVSKPDDYSSTRFFDSFSRVGASSCGALGNLGYEAFMLHHIHKYTKVWGSGMPWLYRQALAGHIPSVDSTVLTDIEVEVGKIATSVDSLTENLAGILHSMSALTVECLETHRDVVCKTCDAVDLNIKSMYQLMAKCEELSKSMQSIYKLADHIKEIKHFLDIFENTLN